MNAIKSLVFFPLVGIAASAALSADQSESVSRIVSPTQEIEFIGTANGGILSIGDVMNRNSAIVSIQTNKGESAESVVSRLAGTINGNPVFIKRWGKAYHRDGSLILLGGPPPSIGGTETGFGIHPPPNSLSARFDPGLRVFEIEWEEPEGGFDLVRVGVDSGVVGSARTQSEKKVTITPREYHLFKGWEEIGILVTAKGYKNGLSSAAAVMVGGCSQEERVSLPFFGGIHPNWMSWTTSEAPKAADFSIEWKDFAKQADYQFLGYQKPTDKPTFQRIGNTSPVSSGGILRRFLGLVPGSTYRIRVRVNTLQMTPAQSGWSFEVLAAYNRPGREPLTPGQLSGVEPLPNGGKGKDAGLLARFGPDRTTSGEWFEIDTSKSPDTSKQGDITLPPDVDTITLWIRYQAEGPTTGVGMDWVALEDLTCTK